MSDQQQILRLLATIREEVAEIRSRQEELYEILISYKDQIHSVEKAVEEGLAGLPKSPYIAGQLVPAPDQIEGVDEFGQLLATYLHKAPRGEPQQPRDVAFQPPPEVDPDTIELEPNLDRPGRRRGPRHDGDLERGPDRGVVPLDLDEPDTKKKKKRRRPRRRKRGGKAAADKAGGSKKAVETKAGSSKAEDGGGSESEP